MYARVTQVRIQPNKLDEFVEGIHSILPELRQQEGFRALVVMRSDAGGAIPEATVVAVWDSLEALRASEKSMFLYRALSRILTSCEGFPTIHEQAVLLSEFAPQ